MTILQSFFQGYLEQRDRLLQYRTDNSDAKSHCGTGCFKLSKNDKIKIIAVIVFKPSSE